MGEGVVRLSERGSSSYNDKENYIDFKMRMLGEGPPVGGKYNISNRFIRKFVSDSTQNYTTCIYKSLFIHSYMSEKKVNQFIVIFLCFDVLFHNMFCFDLQQPSHDVSFI